jgi:replicative DNA helicase
MSDHLPHDAAVEMAVIGCAMDRPDLGVTEGLTAADFYDQRHATIYRAIADLRDSGEPCSPVPLAAHLAASDALGRVGGHAYLAQLFTAPEAGTATTWHVNRIRSLADVRRAIEGATRIAQMAAKPDADPRHLAGAISELASEVSERLTADGPVRWSQIIDETNHDLAAAADAAASAGGAPGIRTGWADFDRLTSGGLKPGQLMIIAARPGVGKTVCATDVCRSAAFAQEVPTLLVSLEMDRVEVAKRILAAQYRLPLYHLASASLSDDEWVYLAKRSHDHAAAPLWIDDNSQQSLASIRANAQRLHRSDGLGLLVVDYLQLIDTSTGRRQDNRQQEVSALSRGLKLLAREMKIPVVFLAQLNRGPEQRQDKRPMLADLRESGSLEQDADIVMFIHREDYYDKESPRAGECDLIVAKHRGGPTDTITVAAQLHFSRFVDLMAFSAPGVSSALDEGAA